VTQNFDFEGAKALSRLQNQNFARLQGYDKFLNDFF